MPPETKKRLQNWSSFKASVRFTGDQTFYIHKLVSFLPLQPTFHSIQIFPEVESLLKGPEDSMEREMKAKNPAAIAQLYHPDAVIVHKGVKVSYGRDGTSTFNN
jgi:hypothetical protein